MHDYGSEPSALCGLPVLQARTCGTDRITFVVCLGRLHEIGSAMHFFFLLLKEVGSTISGLNL
jgi:hypothetical protein